MKWIKKGSLAAAAIAAALLWLLVWLFLDPIAKWALVKAGETAAGAKVDVGRVRVKLLRGDFLVERVAVANKREPMKNLVELDSADFRFSPAAALRAKAVIDQASVLGLRFGTPRKTSGALPLKGSALTDFEKKIHDQLAPVKEQSLAKLGETKTALPEVDPKKLASGQALDDAQAKLKELEEKTKDRLGVEKLDAQIKDIQAQVEALQKGGGSPQEIAAKAQAAAQLQGKIKALLRQVQDAKAQVAGDYDKVQQALRKAQDLKNKDVSSLLQEAGLPALDADSLTKRLLGRETAKRVETALYWIRWARLRQAASQKQKAKRTPPLRRGVNVEFPLERSYPEFLLVEAKLTGRLEKLFQGQDLDLAGTLGGVTSNPPLYGKPARLLLSGKAAGGVGLELDGLLDETTQPGGAEVKLQYSGFPLAGLSLGDDELTAAVKGGVGRVNGTVRIRGDQWKGQFVLQGDGVSLEPHLGLTGPAAQYASAALSGIRRFTATIGVEGAEDDLRFTIASDLGKAVSDGVKKAASAALLEQRKKLEEKVNALYAQRAAQLQQQAQAKQKELLAPLDRQQAQLQEQLQKAVERAVPGGDLKKALPKGLPKIFR